MSHPALPYIHHRCKPVVPSGVIIHTQATPSIPAPWPATPHPPPLPLPHLRGHHGLTQQLCRLGAPPRVKGHQLLHQVGQGLAVGAPHGGEGALDDFADQGALVLGLKGVPPHAALVLWQQQEAPHDAGSVGVVVAQALMLQPASKSGCQECLAGVRAAASPSG
jgi:hypothetical protein